MQLPRVRPARRTIGTLAAALGAAALLAPLTGCSSGPDASGTGPGSALARLADVPPTGKNATLVTYSDAARERQLYKADKKRYTSVQYAGSSVLAEYTYSGTQYGIKSEMIDEIAALSGTRQAETWTGRFPAKSITAKMLTKGFHKAKNGDDTVLDHNGHEVYAIGDKKLSIASSSAQFAALRPADGRSMADRSDSKAMLDCLDGKPYLVYFTYTSDNPSITSWAVGEYAPKPGQDSETVCAVAKDRATAERKAAALRAGLAAKGPKGSVVTVSKGDHPVVKAVVPAAKTGPTYLVRYAPKYFFDFLDK